MTLKLRPYQLDSLAAIERELAAGVTKQMLVLSTGLGKTCIAAELIKRRGGRALFLAHRDELINQAVDKIKIVAPELADQIGVVKAERDERDKPIVVASIQTVMQPARTLQAKWDTVIADECFPAGTWVSGKPIEEIKAGDLVDAYMFRQDSLGWLVKRRVTRVFKKKPSSLVLVMTDKGGVVCTPDHPFLTELGVEYKVGISKGEASDLLSRRFMAKR